MSKLRLILVAVLIGGTGIAVWFYYSRPYLALKSMNESNEKKVAAAVRTVNVAHVEFLNMNSGRYSKSLDELVKADLIPADYATVFSGYRLHYQAGSDGTTYELRAEPVLNQEKLKHFFSNENALLRVETGKPAGLGSLQFRD